MGRTGSAIWLWSKIITFSLIMVGACAIFFWGLLGFRIETDGQHLVILLMCMIMGAAAALIAITGQYTTVGQIISG